MSCPLTSFSIPVYLFLLIFVIATIFHFQFRLSKLSIVCEEPPVLETPAPTVFHHEGFWTVNSIGRLGNQMGEYATLYALAKLNGHRAYISPEMHQYLAPIFCITLPVLPASVAQHIHWKNYPLHDWMSEEYRHIHGAYVRLTGYPCSWTFYHHLREEIRREFTLHDHVRNEAQAYLHGIQKGPATFVGVHVRRGDYVHAMPQIWKGVVAHKGYLDQAMDWFRARYRDAVFVVTSNGMSWCRENIDTTKGDVVFAGDGVESSPGKDFALLTQCNHTIMTIGTFGIWAAYLAGGETIYLANYTLPDSPFLKVFKPEAAFLPEWIGIPADLSPLLKN
ncbi:galactoside alpha-(1,2)-fucosyltransferase 2-like [Gracilinanus agilis]|uniref:galactoside alpha-(1,2)-fucosyltransferase 2-like n=1 Tax=Gracilinanus agilis TaxID=191870 RepID=UPI001CFDD4BE|nr:galactoside alpha-(1,2)-fucosyltransferase 2-like [Gracilinanus agilis]